MEMKIFIKESYIFLLLEKDLKWKKKVNETYIIHMAYGYALCPKPFWFKDPFSVDSTPTRVFL